MATQRIGDWMQTASGKRFYPLDPRIEEVDIRDIAHHLSLICRFSGACSTFYSVAQHSVLVSQLCQPENALWGLLHDAEEAYMMDMIRPLRNSLRMVHGNPSFWDAWEEKIERVIAQKFNLGWPQPTNVKTADDLALTYEALNFMQPLDPEWAKQITDTGLYHREISPQGPEAAKASFLEWFEHLRSLST